MSDSGFVPSRGVLGAVAGELKAKLLDCGFHVGGIQSFLGAEGYAALRRGEPGAVLWSVESRKHKPLAVLISAFLVHASVAREELERVLGEDLVSTLIDAGVLGSRSVFMKSPCEDEGLTALIDVQPHIIAGRNCFVFSDVDASQLVNYVPGSEHVLGVGAASLSLLATTPSTPVDTVLDLGVGSGVQVLGQLGVAGSICATDIHGRALDFASATLAGCSGSEIELLEGSWFEPVAGRSFDRIIANPPFVVGAGAVDLVYRDSGLNLDGATELVVGGACEHLALNGSAHLLGAWAHVRGQSWRERVASWLPDQGVCALILQRDVVSPETYVGTWLRDESIDPRSELGQRRTREWLEHFAREQVEAIGFGYIAIVRVDDDQASDVLLEEFSHATDSQLGEEIQEYFLRLEWLNQRSAEDIVNSCFMLRPTVAKEEVSVADRDAGMGFSVEVVRLVRMDGPRWSHEVDAGLVSIISGMHPQGLCLGEIVDLFALSRGLDPEAVREAVIGPVVDLVRHGLLLPADLMHASDDSDSEE
ncbi:MAG: methyltransferase [Corynebacterium sp.]|uniref:DUF7782 domain-containing protein n=1 Tax=Corynebacterium sp. TaxID=1720 RepID=UPI0026DCE958|nr:methyltransferase [Corynebacterium sp.]MDO4760707.1 methyltransferase [Corynebacterium sp.]